jgi:hypothetical protein
MVVEISLKDDIPTQFIHALSLGFAIFNRAESENHDG